ncbi:MAG TPA: FAD-dependent oxidoreductase [Dongiaceae bacterium]|nr:FAD-dependent oxidoreductase [Dongiaceae bacterium]
MRRLQCDVVVVGCGVAGLSAALSALEQNAKVIVLERAPQEDRGGNTRWTEALLRVKDDLTVWDDFEKRYLDNSGYYIFPEFIRATAKDYETWPALVKALAFVDPELLTTFMEGIPDGLKWLESYGVKTHPSMYPYLPPVKHLGLYGGGLALVETLCPTIEKKGAQILYETTATALLQDEDNRVTGLKAVDAAGDSVIIDAKSVVLACGGFEGNPEMLAKYIGSQARYMRPVARGGWYNKGEGIRMALDAGAAPAGDFADVHRQPIDPRSSASEALINAFPLGIVVNKNGERFFNEAHSEYDYYAEEPCVAINRQPGGIGFFVYDAKIDEVPNWRIAIRSDQPAIVADTLPELARKLGISVNGFMQTVETFNRACTDGPIDVSKFDHRSTKGIVPEKSNFARSISVAPFGAYPIITSATFTYGGLKVTRDSQVVSASGSVIRGLYAAGETVGIIYGIYVGATSVLRGLVFGRRAGAHAGKRSRA